MTKFNRRIAGKRGFTLIELLIVIAIILILIAIALPNFLAAQLRARVVRLRADMRALATSMEAYYTDWDTYALQYTHGFWQTRPHIYMQRSAAVALSTPIPYIKEAMTPDIFRAISLSEREQTLFVQVGSGYYGASNSHAKAMGSQSATQRAVPDFDSLYPTNVYTFVSAGPDSRDNTRLWTYPWSSCSSGGSGVNFTEGCIYTPTNGAKSNGDLIVTSGRMPHGWAYGGTRGEIEARLDPWAQGYH